MKRFLKLFSQIIAVIICVSCTTGCMPSFIEKVDNTKTQLYIANYSGGAGTEWLNDVKTRFEEKYKDERFEEGKVGVQLMVSHDKNYEWSKIKDIIKTDQNDIYFTQNVDYYNAASEGLFYDLTDFIEQVNVNDNKTIKSKLYDYHINNLSVSGKYYALPHYELYQGLTYDAGVFESKKLYFADSIDNTDTTYPGTRTFVVNKNTKKSCGPDGIYNTYDDGLPSSFQEFHKLIDKMTSGSNVIPFVWTGKSMHYTSQLICALYVNYAKANGVNINFTFDSLGQNFEYVEKFDGDIPVIKNTVITKDNAYLTKQSAGLYYALELAKKVFTNDKYYYVDCIAGTFSHLNAMEEFMYSGLEGSDDKPIAMLIDGNYWYNEATEDKLFERVEDDFPITYKNKNVKFMPLPVQYAGTVTEGNGHAPTLVDAYSSYAIVNANIDSKVVDLAKTFLSFCYSDAELQTYTKNTRGVVKGVKYEVPTDSLPSFSQSVVEIRDAAEKSGELVYGFSNNPIFVKSSNSLYLSTSSNFWLTGNYSTAYTAFVNGVSVKDVFNGMWISASDWASKYL